MGCASQPKPPQAVNCALAKRLDASALNDPNATQVVARCQQVERYATRTNGNWETLYHRVECEVIAVQRGAWAEPTVSFIWISHLPTVESGILIGMAPTPFRIGNVLLVTIDKSGQVPTVVAVKEQPATAVTQIK